MALDIDPETFGTMTTREFAVLVKESSEQDLKDLFSGPNRNAAISAIMERFPVQFRPERAEGVSTRLDMKWTDGPDGSSDLYGVHIDSGACAVEKDPEGEPDVLLTSDPIHFLKLITGNGNPVMLVMMGKIKARGDLSKATQFQSWFELPKA